MQVELIDITKRFGPVLANDRVSLTVPAGSICGLLGENGAGKSTLVKVLSGFIRRDGGEIRLNGRVVAIRSPADAIAAGIGMLHQDPLDFPPLSVLENFCIGQTGPWILSRRAARTQLRTLADSLGFILDPDRPVASLTVGERQQLELLRLLALGVQTLILDEPTTGISASQKQALFTAIQALAKTGRSLILVSHKLADVQQLCHTITVMRQGQVVGSRTLPCPTADLVSLMFGRELAQPTPKLASRGESSQPMLQLQDLIWQDPPLALQMPDLRVQPGEVIGLAGLEGSGQRSFLLLCAGLLAAQAGTLRVNGVDLTHQPYRAYQQAGVGFLPADRLKEGLIPGLSIQEHVAVRTAAQQWFVNWRQVLTATQEAIARFNIRGRPSTRVETLSGGNQQRTQLALLPTPLNLLLMEHPTRGLDMESSLWVWQQLLARCQTGTAIIFTSSDLDEIVQYSDRILVFSGGHVSAPLKTAEVTIATLGHMIGGQLPPPSYDPAAVTA
ncbi:ABC transporter ATP-binding protein [Trichothermofontia sp.]